MTEASESLLTQASQGKITPVTMTKKTFQLKHVDFLSRPESPLRLDNGLYLHSTKAGPQVRCRRELGPRVCEWGGLQLKIGTLADSLALDKRGHRGCFICCVGEEGGGWLVAQHQRSPGCRTAGHVHAGSALSIKIGCGDTPPPKIMYPQYLIRSENRVPLKRVHCWVKAFFCLCLVFRFS